MRDKTPSRTDGANCAGKLSLRRRLRGRTASSSSTKFDNGDRALSLLARKIAPEAVFCRAAYLSSLRQSFDGSRIVRILPLSAISVLPFFAASTVMYCTSSPRVSSCLLSRNRRRWIFRNRARQSVQPQNQKKPFSAAKQALMVDGA
jgi:hypothetical protein